MSGLRFICTAIVAVSLFVASGGVQGPDSVARIGAEYYDSLQAAFDAAKTGDDVVLVRDVVWQNATEATLLSVVSDKSFRLDLKGFSIVATNCLESSSQLFEIRGSLTIDDTSAGATGRIAFNPLTPSVYTSGMPAYVSNVFTVKGGRHYPLQGHDRQRWRGRYLLCLRYGRSRFDGERDHDLERHRSRREHGCASLGDRS